MIFISPVGVSRQGGNAMGRQTLSRDNSLSLVRSGVDRALAT